MQALVKSGLPVTGKRVVVAGTGPLLLAVADLLRSRGAIVPMIAEQASACRIRGFALSLARTPSKLAAGAWLRARLLGAAYSTDSYVLGVVNQGPSLRVSVRRGNRQKTVDCDYLACGFHLIPNNELPQVLGCDLTLGGYVRADGRLRTTAPNVYAVGELTGIGGVDKAVIEGRIAAHTAVGDETAARSLARAHAASLHFAARLDAAFALRSELLQLARPDTVICRCEDVRAGAVSQWLSARDAKLQTRCGMGPCQGRTCGPVLERVFSAEPQGVRPPIFPVAVGTLAAGASEASA
jgi:NADPH-dependent 2,4-dienoyl-CoA reductase/sulfur reductase-like enzyme